MIKNKKSKQWQAKNLKKKITFKMTKLLIEVS